MRKMNSIFFETNWRIRGGIIISGGALALAGAGCGGATKSETSAPPNVQLGQKVLLKGSNHQETEQFGANTFRDYVNASGVGHHLEKGNKVDVDCLATGPVDAAPSAEGKWYHIESPEPYSGDYVAANTFENGNASNDVAVDPRVPDCPTP